MLVLSLLLPLVAAAQKPDNVLVVVNDASPVSRRIAQYYAERRAIPKSNLCRIRTAADEEIPRAVYDSEIAAPVSAFLRAQGLRDRILYIVTTLGVPLRIAGSGGMDGETAAVDSELAAIYQDIGGKPHPLRGPLRNPFYGRRDSPFTHPQFPIYLVTRLAGYDFDDARALVDRALAAKNQGMFVIDLKDGTDQRGNDWLRDAALLLPKERVVFDETREVLYGQKRVIGFASWGSNDRSRKRRLVGFEWLPGAIMTEYVSTNGRTFLRPPDNWNITDWSDRAHFFAGSPQTLSADYIHEGATGASGHVAEPFLQFTPRPDYLLPAYYAGRTLAESYYLATPALSWQNIVVGDPLCTLGKP